MTIKWILPTTLPIFRFNPTAAVGNPFMWNPMSKGISSSTFRYHTIMPMPTFNFKFPLFSNPTLTLNNSSKSTRLNGGFGENIVSTAKNILVLMSGIIHINYSQMAGMKLGVRILQVM